MKKITRTILYAISALVLINLAACKKLSSYELPPSVGTAYDIVSNDNNYSTFKYCVDKAGLGSLFTGKDAYTVFVPINSAFLNAGYTMTILQNMTVADVTTLVKNHLVAGKVNVTSLGSSMDESALSSLKITVQKIGNIYYANGGDITNTNQTTTNGYVDIVNTLLTSRATLNDVINNYSNATANSQLTFLAAAIARASTGSTNFTALLTGTTPYTFFAPNNGAFIDGGYASIAAINAAAPDVIGNILKYHLIAGAKFTTAFDSVPMTAYSGNPIYFDKLARFVIPTTTAATNISLWYANGIYFGDNVPSNLLAGNGVLHMVSRFLPTPLTTNTITRISTDATLTMFYALIQRAGQAGTDFNALLSSPTASYTVFAVNNTGLQAAGYADINAINAEDPKILANILRLHMVQRRINNIDIGTGSVSTLLNVTNASTGVATPDAISFTPAGTGFTVQGPSNPASTPVLTPNVVTTNGILNIIGAILKP